MDKSLTGTRFVKLYDALIDGIGYSRFLPIAMLFHDVERPNIANDPNRKRLVERVQSQVNRIGYPNGCIEFPRQRPFRVNEGNHVFWESPVIWNGSELIVGKRKVNLIFMLLDHFFDLIEDMGRAQSVFKDTLEVVWCRNEMGQQFDFAPDFMHTFFQDAIKDLPLNQFRDCLWRLAKEQFPQDYTGNLDDLSKIGAIERHDWLRDTFITEATKRIGEARASTLWNAVDAVFSSTFFQQAPKASRDLDATLYTLPFNETIQSFNRWLIEKLVARARELDRL